MTFALSLAITDSLSPRTRTERATGKHDPRRAILWLEGAGHGTGGVVLRLRLLVSALQAEDLGTTIAIGDRIPIEVLGFWGGALGQEVQSLPAFYSSTPGNKSLRSIGIAEYAFSGEVIERKSLEDYGAPGVRYQELLVDCGVPLILVTRGTSPIQALNVDTRTLGEPKTGHHVTGLAILDARIAFRYPTLIEREISAAVVGLEELNLLPRSEAFGETRPCHSSADRDKGMPFIITVENG